MIKRGRPKIRDAELIAHVIRMSGQGSTMRGISEALKGLGYVNTKGNPYDPTTIARLLRRHT